LQVQGLPGLHIKTLPQIKNEKKKKNTGWGCISVVKHQVMMHKTLDFIPINAKTKTKVK
jgi:hypothetical protein